MFGQSILLAFCNNTSLPAQQISPGNLAHTFSIVARDAETGEMGVAVQTHWFGVGTRVTWAEAGLGAIATQSFTNPSFGPRGLALIRQGKTAAEVVKELIDSDDGRDFRQLAVIDHQGRVAAWTGEKCIKDAGHTTGDNFSVQANLMLNDKVWPAMAGAFKNAKGHLADRLLAALEAGQAAGGDIRGKQSAALIIVKKESTGKPWQDRLIDLRIDDHGNPILELKRLLKVRWAYIHMNKGDAALEEKDVDRALREYGMAEALYPENIEMKYWHAVALANSGRVQASLPIFKTVFQADDNWRTLTQRLPASDLLNVSEEDLEKILALR